MQKVDDKFMRHMDDIRNNIAQIVKDNHLNEFDVGTAVARSFDWDVDAIQKAFIIALGDANAHSYVLMVHEAYEKWTNDH